MSFDILIALSLFTIGFLYASVGHGGASGYLAVLSLYAIPVLEYKPVILILNIVVASMAFWQFTRSGYFKWSLCWPFLLTSLPLAFLGSKFPVQGNIYNLLLGIALIVPVIKLLGFTPAERGERKKIVLPLALLLGGLVGFLSGMLSIGGGIFLSPLLMLLAWSNAKEAAAVSSLFIVLNSAAGLLGTTSEIVFTQSSIIWFIAAMIGGSVGAYYGSHKFAHATVRYLLTAVLAIASCKLIFFM